MKFVNTTLVLCGLLVASLLAAAQYAPVSLKEQCLRSGGTSVEIRGQFERCIPKE